MISLLFALLVAAPAPETTPRPMYRVVDVGTSGTPALNGKQLQWLVKIVDNGYWDARLDQLWFSTLTHERPLTVIEDGGRDFKTSQNLGAVFHVLGEDCRLNFDRSGALDAFFVAPPETKCTNDPLFEGTSGGGPRSQTAKTLLARLHELESSLQTQPCVQGKTKVPSVCGSLRVYENRDAGTGRTIRVHFIVLKARRPSGRVIYVNLGGPGSELSEAGAIADGEFFKELQTLRDRYDVLFVDERGFGESHSIPCELSPPNDPAAYFTHLWPQQLLEACRRREAKRSDLSQYHTTRAIADLDDIRAALGYKKIVFDVASYGTFTALLYMRAYPQNVESAVLQGVDPPGIDDLMRGFAAGAQASLDRLTKECANDERCRAHFPHFRQEFDTVLARMNGNTMPVEVRIPAKRVVTVQLSREVFVDAMRHLLYEPESASIVPLVIDQAYRGKTLLLGNAIQLLTQGFARGIDDGAFLSYTCAESIPFTGSPETLAFARTTWFGDDRVRAQTAACNTWDVPAMPASFNTPIRSDAPVLMINGTDDPATPPQEAQAQLAYLPNGGLMLVRNAPHDAESPCTDRTVVAFVRARSIAGLNLNACSSNFTRPPFATKAPDFLR